MIFYLITVLLGTLYPIFTDVLTNYKISVGPPFYNTVIFPIVIVFLIFMAVGPKTKWINNKFENKKVLSSILLGAIFMNLIIIYFFKGYSIISNLIIISSLFLIISSLIDLNKSFNNLKFHLARIISHTSFGFLILFIGLNHNFSIEKDFNIKLGETKNFEDYKIKFQSLELKSFINYKSVVGNLKINDLKQNEEITLTPEIRIYENPETLTYEAAIKTSFLKDYYLTMSNIDQSEYYNIKFQKKPLMVWIWISVIMVSFGGFLRLFKNAKSN